MEMKSAAELGISTASVAGEVDPLLRSKQLVLVAGAMLFGGPLFLGLGAFGHHLTPELGRGVIPLVLMGTGGLESVLGLALMAYALNLRKSAQA